MSLAKKRAALSEKAATLKAAGDKLKELVGIETLTAEQVTELKKLTEEVTNLRKECDDLTGEIQSIEAAVKATEFVVPAATPAPAAPEVKSQVQIRSTDGVLKVGLVVAAAAAVKQGNYESIGKALEENGYGQVATELAVGKQLQATAGTGGVAIPPTMASDLIEFLRPQTTFMQLGPRVIPMPNGTYTQAGGNTGASASYGAENSVPAYSEATLREINMSGKELKAKTAVSNLLLTLGLPQIRSFIETDIRDACSETMDLNMFLGDGLQGRPLGLYNIPGIQTKAAVNSTTPTIAQIDLDLRWAINSLATRNVNMGTAQWTMSYQTFGYLQDLRDGNGNFYFPTLQTANPTLKQLPVRVTTNLPTNLGGGTNESHISLTAATHVLFGEQPGLTVKVSDEATYTDANAQLRSAAERNETVMFLFMRHDVALRHLAALAVLTAVKWGR